MIPTLAPAIASAPHFRVPAGACDCHFHLFSYDERYRMTLEIDYRPPVAPFEEFRRMQTTLGVDRGVLVHSSFYGTDNRLLLDTLERHAGLRGIAVIDEETSDEYLRELARAPSIKGIRVSTGAASPAKLAQIERLVSRIAPLGWHLQLHTDGKLLPQLAPRLVKLGVDVVFDHMARLAPEGAGGSAEFKALAGLLEGGRTWVKLSAPYRLTSQVPPYSEVTPLARALIAIAPERMVWGTDWPNIMYAGEMPDAGALLDCLALWAPQENVRNKILVENPASLYGF